MGQKSEKTKSMQNKGKSFNITKVAFIIMIISGTSKILALLRETTLASYFGATYETDAYRMAAGVPSILFALISAAIATTFIPVYSDYIKKKSKEQGLYFVNNILNIFLLISVALLAVGCISSPILVKIAAPGFKGEVFDLTVKLTVIMLPSFVFISLSNLASGYLQSNNSFIPSVFNWIPYNMIIIISTSFFYKYGIEAVAAGSVLASASLFMVQLPSIYKKGYRYKPILNFKEEGLRMISGLLIPIIASSAFNQVDVLINRVLASGLNEGSISALDYADKVNNLVYNMFIVTFATVIYPGLSLASNDPDKFKVKLIKGLRYIIILSLPAMGCLFVLRTPIVSLLFERGAFNAADTYNTSIALGCYSAGIIGEGFREILNRAYYSLKDTKTPMVNGIAAICINVVLNIIFVKFWGIGGLAISTSITAILSGLMLFYNLKKKIGIFAERSLTFYFLKVLISSGVMALIIYILEYIVFRRFGTGSFIKQAFMIISCICVGVTVYISILYTLKVEEVIHAVDVLKNRIYGYMSNIPVKPGFIPRSKVHNNMKGYGNMNRYAVIMAGGNGTRFWPLSRQHMPKQFLNISGNGILINETMKRLDGIIQMKNTFIVTNKRQYEISRQMITHDFSRTNLIVEPIGRNTGACIAYASMVISKKDKDAVMCILPSDHYIKNENRFKEILSEAIKAAEVTHKLVMIGIKPTFPSTGYGYIRYNKNNKRLDKFYEVTEFIEKPAIEKAVEYAADESCLWNSGIIVCKVSTMLANIQRYLPRLSKEFQEIEEYIGTEREQEFIEKIYPKLQRISIDFGVMERSDELLVISGDLDWTDVGSWETIQSISVPDENNNTIMAKHVGLDTGNSLIYGSNRLITTIGIDNMIIVDTVDALMICPKNRVQEVKLLIEAIKSKGLEKYL